MIAEPAPLMIMVLPLIAATLVLLLLYEKVPILFEFGGVILNVASPYVFEAIVKPLIVGAIAFTVTLTVPVALA